MTITIDGPKALKLLRGAIKLKGEGYIDPKASTGAGCKYVVNGAPSCIVGHAIASVKPDLIPLIEIWERREADSSERYYEDSDSWRASTLEEGHPGDTNAAALLDSLGVSVPDLKFTPDAERIFIAAQDAQDSGRTWGEALEKAKAVAASTRSTSMERF